MVCICARERERKKERKERKNGGRGEVVEGGVACACVYVHTSAGGCATTMLNAKLVSSTRVGQSSPVHRPRRARTQGQSPGADSFFTLP